MERIRMILIGKKEEYHLNGKKIEINEELRLILRNDSGEWEEFRGRVKNGASLRLAPTQSHAEELWVTIPGFHDFRVSYLHGSHTKMARI